MPDLTTFDWVFLGLVVAIPVGMVAVGFTVWITRIVKDRAKTATCQPGQGTAEQPSTAIPRYSSLALCPQCQQLLTVSLDCLDIPSERFSKAKPTTSSQSTEPALPR